MNKLTKNQIYLRKKFSKKISLNINIGIMRLVKELSKLTKTNNTLVIESLLVKGISPLTKQFRDTWITLSCTTKDKAKKENQVFLQTEISVNAVKLIRFFIKEPFEKANRLNIWQEDLKNLNKAFNVYISFLVENSL